MAVHHCRHCGRANDRALGMRYCVNCGRDFPAGAASDAVQTKLSNQRFPGNEQIQRTPHSEPARAGPAFDVNDRARRVEWALGVRIACGVLILAGGLQLGLAGLDSIENGKLTVTTEIYLIFAAGYFMLSVRAQEQPNASAVLGVTLLALPAPEIRLWWPFLLMAKFILAAGFLIAFFLLDASNDFASMPLKRPRPFQELPPE
jgi:hypothetical protein